jgi:tetratricopeptide (TPR) repeat protein
VEYQETIREEGRIFSIDGLAAVAHPGGRLVSTQNTQEQSQGFRKLLWKTAVSIILSNPAGTGAGSFRYESTKPGIVPQTQMAHQGFLQLASENGVGCLMALLSLIGFWLAEMFRGGRTAEPEKRALRAAIVGGVAAALAHNLVDSDLQHFGTLVGLFMLIDVGVQLGVDAITPEFMSRQVGYPLRIGTILAIISVLFVTWLDGEKARMRGTAQATGRVTAAIGLAQLVPFDGELALIAAYEAQTPMERLDWIKRGVRGSPSMRSYRLLARAHEDIGQSSEARSALNSALRLDPNNLPTLMRLLELAQAKGDDQEVERVSRRIVGIESKPYLRVKALPEIIDTEPFEARLYLERLETDRESKIQLLREAIAGFRRFAEVTAPKIVAYAKVDPNIVFAGVSLEDVRYGLASALEATDRLERLSALDGDATAARAVFVAMSGEVEALLRNRSTN